MDLALVSLQRRGDICALTYDQIQEGRLIIIQEKTEKHGVRARLSIEYSSQLEAIIKASRSDKVASPFVLHKRPARITRSVKKTHWTQILPDYLSKQFGDARDSVDKFKTMPAHLKPTFHEIRALGGWLYLEQGHSKEYINLLMGHTKMAMTDHYTDRHMEYTECKAELDVKNF
jgi:integrase